MKTSTLSKLAGATAIALIGTFAGGANAQIITPTSDTPYASGLTSPSGTIQLGDSQWIADHLQGFCRLDPVPASNPPTVAINASTCVTAATSPGQPSVDRGRNFVYVPDNASQSRGVWRLKFDPTLKIVFKTSRTVANRPTLLTTPLLTSGGRTVRPTATAVDGAGNLYIGSIRTGNIIKVTKPFVAPTDPTQTERIVGQTSDGISGVASLGFVRVRERINATTTVVHQDLYIAEGGAVSVLFDANTCGNCGPAGAVVEFIEDPNNPDATREPVALTSFFNTPATSTGKVFVGLGSHDFTVKEVQEYTATLDGLVFTGKTYTIPDPIDPDPNDAITPPSPVITGLGVSSNGRTLFVGDDPSVGIEPPPEPPLDQEQGFLWQFTVTP